MAPRFINLDRDTSLLLPPNRRDWVPADHLVHFILDAVDALDLRQIRVNTRDTGGCAISARLAAGAAPLQLRHRQFLQPPP